MAGSVNIYAQGKPKEMDASEAVENTYTLQLSILTTIYIDPTNILIYIDLTNECIFFFSFFLLSIYQYHCKFCASL